MEGAAGDQISLHLETVVDGGRVEPTTLLATARIVLVKNLLCFSEVELKKRFQTTC